MPDAVCSAGQCVGERDTNPDNNTCTVEACNGSGSVSVVNPDDFNACTVDTCDISGTPVHTPIPAPSDNVACTVDSCNNFGGVLHTPDDSLCAAGEGCDVDEGCVADVYVNDTDVALEADFCNVQFPTAPTEVDINTSVDFFGQIFEGGMTNANDGQTPGIRAQIGIGTDRAALADFIFSEAVFNTASPGNNTNNDEYRGVFVAPVAGNFRVLFRFSLDDGRSWTACDVGGAGSDNNLSFNIENAAQITVFDGF